jgi:hypothetical protein
MSQQLLSVKLVSGEEVLAKLVTFSGEVYHVTDPRVIHLIPTQTGQLNVSLPPLMLSAPEGAEIEIHRSAVMSRNYNITDNFEKMYWQTVSKLDLTSRIQT